MKSNFLTVILIIFGLFTGCNKDNLDNKSSVSGEISYNGEYTGNNKTIYVRGYISNSNATGVPDFTTSTTTGKYTLDLGSYTGDLYLSAFMDINNSGSLEGPDANMILIEGVYGDPMGCFGDYTFEINGPDKLNINGTVADINFELTDCGVIRVSFSDMGSCTFGVIKDNILSDTFLHHKHFDVNNINDTFLLPVPSKNGWFCKVKFDNLSTAQLYPNAINVTVNGMTEIVL